jgi:catalase (peroxidase I)
VADAVSPVSPSADGSGSQNISMLTSDVSLTKDPAYFEIVKRFAGDSKAFGDAFSQAWYVYI